MASKQKKKIKNKNSFFYVARFAVCGVVATLFIPQLLGKAIGSLSREELIFLLIGLTGFIFLFEPWKLQYKK
jgi:hypothetical protein